MARNLHKVPRSEQRKACQVPHRKRRQMPLQHRRHQDRGSQERRERHRVAGRFSEHGQRRRPQKQENHNFWRCHCRGDARGESCADIFKGGSSILFDCDGRTASAEQLQAADSNYKSGDEQGKMSGDAYLPQKFGAGHSRKERRCRGGAQPAVDSVYRARGVWNR